MSAALGWTSTSGARPASGSSTGAKVAISAFAKGIKARTADAFFVRVDKKANP